MNVRESDLRKGERISRRLLPATASMVLLAAGLVYAVPRWWAWIILAVIVFAFAGDASNVLYASWKRRDG